MLEEQLKDLELEWNKSIEENDVERMSSFMSDEWVIFSGDGNITTKEIFLNLVKSGDLVHTQMDFKMLETKIFGNTGLVMQKGTSAGKWKEQEFSNYEIASTVFIKENGKWLAIQTMIAPVT